MYKVNTWRTRFFSDFWGISDNIYQIPNVSFIFPALGCSSSVTKVGSNFTIRTTVTISVTPESSALNCFLVFTWFFHLSSCLFATTDFFVLLVIPFVCAVTLGWWHRKTVGQSNSLESSITTIYFPLWFQAGKQKNISGAIKAPVAETDQYTLF